MNFDYLIPPDIHAYALKRSGKPTKLLQELWDYTHTHTDMPQMLTGPIEAGFLQMLVAITGAKRVLEVGTFTGYSALAMAAALPDGGKLVTCDVSESNLEIAQTFFARSEDGGKIEIAAGPALRTLQGMIEEKQPLFDMVFVDADKTNYPRYLQKCYQLTRIGGLMVFDNALWGGQVLADEQDEVTRGIDRLNIMLEHDPNLQNVLLTVRDGMQLARKIK